MDGNATLRREGITRPGYGVQHTVVGLDGVAVPVGCPPFAVQVPPTGPLPDGVNWIAMASWARLPQLGASCCKVARTLLHPGVS